jgi:hypothetical protein
VLNIIARSPDRAGFGQHADWARATHRAIAPWSGGGAYVNFTSEQAEDRVRASYPPDTYARLGGEGPLRPDQPVPAQPEHPPSGRG